MGLDRARWGFRGHLGRDVAGGRTAGCRTILINGDGPPPDDARPTVVVKTFAEAVETVLHTPASTRRAVNEEHADEDPDQPPIAQRHAGTEATGTLADLRRDLAELTEEIRAQRLRSHEFTGFLLAAGLCQLFALLLALLGLLQLGSADAFTKWMLGAAMVQLLTIAILLLDLRG